METTTTRNKTDVEFPPLGVSVIWNFGLAKHLILIFLWENRTDNIMCLFYKTFKNYQLR